jgi:hypothetical protein
LEPAAAAHTSHSLRPQRTNQHNPTELITMVSSGTGIQQKNCFLITYHPSLMVHWWVIEDSMHRISYLLLSRVGVRTLAFLCFVIWIGLGSW